VGIRLYALGREGVAGVAPPPFANAGTPIPAANQDVGRGKVGKSDSTEGKTPQIHQRGRNDVPSLGVLEGDILPPVAWDAERRSAIISAGVRAMHFAPRQGKRGNAVAFHGAVATLSRMVTMSWTMSAAGRPRPAVGLF